MTRVQRIPSGLLNVSEIDSSRAHRLSFLRHHFRTVLAVQGSSAAPIGAPWTAPGRSEQHFPTRGKARKKKSSAALRLPLVGDDPAPHNGTPTTDRERAGLNATTKVRLQLGGEILFLTFPLIEPKGCRFESYLRSQQNKRLLARRQQQESVDLLHPQYSLTILRCSPRHWSFFDWHPWS